MSFTSTAAHDPPNSKPSSVGNNIKTSRLKYIARMPCASLNAKAPCSGRCPQSAPLNRNTAVEMNNSAAALGTSCHMPFLVAADLTTPSEVAAVMVAPVPTRISLACKSRNGCKKLDTC